VRLLAALFCAAAALVLATPAAAQDENELGSRVLKRHPASSNGEPERRATLIWHTFTRCMAEKRGASVRRLLEVENADALQQTMAVLSREVQCNIGGPDMITGYSLNAPLDVQRGMYAEALLARMRHPLGLPALARVAVYHSGWNAVSGRSATVDEMAVCVADTNPGGVEALLATDANSREELAVFGALSASFGPCLVANTQLNATRVGVRAALAEALYHRVMAPAEPAPAQAASK
jgi:hypothetical protein